MPRRRSREFIVTVRLLSGASVSLICRKHHKVGSLLEKARLSFGAALCTEQFLLWNDVGLHPGQSLRSVPLDSGSVLQLVVLFWSSIFPFLRIRVRAR